MKKSFDSVMPIGPLMVEHRLIERLVRRIAVEMIKIRDSGKIDTVFMDKTVNFINSYADKLHHGKEENILFKALRDKKLSTEHQRMIEELILDHELGRTTTKSIVHAFEGHLNGNPDAHLEVIRQMGILVDFYPRHIEKEDKHFFIPAMSYFDKDEQLAMLAEMYEFDRKFIQQEYRTLVDALEKG